MVSMQLLKLAVIYQVHDILAIVLMQLLKLAVIYQVQGIPFYRVDASY
jgi:hypothetical protein